MNDKTQREKKKTKKTKKKNNETTNSTGCIGRRFGCSILDALIIHRAFPIPHTPHTHTIQIQNTTSHLAFSCYTQKRNIIFYINIFLFPFYQAYHYRHNGKHLLILLHPHEEILKISLAILLIKKEEKLQTHH